MSAKALQERLRQELNERIPRGPRGSPQNELRARWWQLRMHGRSFDEAVSEAVAEIRKRDKGFEPRILVARRERGSERQR